APEVQGEGGKVLPFSRKIALGGRDRLRYRTGRLRGPGMRKVSCETFLQRIGGLDGKHEAADPAQGPRDAAEAKSSFKDVMVHHNAILQPEHKHKAPQGSISRSSGIQPVLNRQARCVKGALRQGAKGRRKLYLCSAEPSSPASFFAYQLCPRAAPCPLRAKTRRFARIRQRRPLLSRPGKFSR